MCTRLGATDGKLLIHCYNFMVVLSQRKPEEESSTTEKEETEAPVKKARQDEEQVAQPTPAVTENGHAKN